MSKVKTSLKGILFLLLILVVIAGVVLAVIFWPQKPEEIKDIINDQVEITLNESEFKEEWDKYNEYTASFSDKNDYSGYTAIDNIFDGLQIYFGYLGYTMENADFSTYNRNNLNHAKNNLNSAKDKLSEIATYLKDKNQSLTKPTKDSREYNEADAILVWNNVKVDLKSCIENYYNATKYLALVYRENVQQGVYANEFAYQVIDNISYYLDYFYSNYGIIEIANYDANTTKTYTQMSVSFYNLVDNYLSDSSEGRLVSNYIVSNSLQTDISNFVRFEELTGVKMLDFVKSGFELSLEDPTFTQSEAINTAIKFYRGGFAK